MCPHDPQGPLTRLQVRSKGDPLALCALLRQVQFQQRHGVIMVKLHGIHRMPARHLPFRKKKINCRGGTPGVCGGGRAKLFPLAAALGMWLKG
tara:strand:- start:540 stop:818 length:279 start_codon:yes stop_codon:yes gene_type:complete